MQIQTTVRYHHSHIKMATTKKKNQKNKCWKEFAKLEVFVHGWQKCKMVQLLLKMLQQFLNSLNTELPYDLAIQLLVYTRIEKN